MRVKKMYALVTTIIQNSRSFFFVFFFCIAFSDYYFLSQCMDSSALIQKSIRGKLFLMHICIYIYIIGENTAHTFVVFGSSAIKK
jgi:hypothetical protein